MQDGDTGMIDLCPNVRTAESSETSNRPVLQQRD